MQDNREARDRGGNPFDVFGGLGNFGGFGGSVFRRNIFDDPFFTYPFDNMPAQRDLRINEPQINNSKGPLIQELESDDEELGILEGEGNNGKNSSTSNTEPFVDHPDDETRENNRNEYVNHREDLNRVERTKPQTFKNSTIRVTYGGVDGTYYTSEATRRMGSDGVMMEECKEADNTTGQAKHRISRGINNKGHSLTRKLNSDGNVDTLQTLHNLNEDELGSFEEAWKDNSTKHLPGWDSSFGVHRNAGGGSENMATSSNWDRLLLPPSFGMGRRNNRAAAAAAASASENSSSGGQAKKVVRINIE